MKSYVPFLKDNYMEGLALICLLVPQGSILCLVYIGDTYSR